MSRNRIGTIVPASTSGAQLAALLTNFGISLEDMWQGSGRPSWAGLGTFYLDTTNTDPVIMICGAAVDGSQDIPWLVLKKGNVNQVAIYDSNGIGQPSSMATLLSLLATATGASSGSDGARGLVPQPLTGQQGLFLRGDMTYAAPDSARFPVVTLSTDTTLTTGSLTKIHKLTAAKTHTLPAGSGLHEGDYIDFEGAFVGRCTINPNGSDTIDGASSKTAFAYHVFRLEWNGSGWQTVGERTGTIRDINEQSGDYTFKATDIGRPVHSTGSSSQTFTIPLKANEAGMRKGAQIDLKQNGTGQLSIAAAVGVTLNSDSSKNKISSRYCGASIVCDADDVWTLFGSIKA